MKNQIQLFLYKIGFKFQLLLLARIGPYLISKVNQLHIIFKKYKYYTVIKRYQFVKLNYCKDAIFSSQICSFGLFFFPFTWSKLYNKIQKIPIFSELSKEIKIHRLLSDNIDRIFEQILTCTSSFWHPYNGYVSIRSLSGAKSNSLFSSTFYNF